jgi:hypothetical protein
MSRCNYIKPGGERCTAAAKGSHGGCWHHDPDFQSARVRNASRGGRGRVNTEMRAVKKLMDELTAKVLEGEVLPSVAHAVVALQNIKLRAIEAERKIRETEELEARLDALEETLERNQQRKEGTQWGRFGASG